MRSTGRAGTWSQGTQSASSASSPPRARAPPPPPPPPACHPALLTIDDIVELLFHELFLLTKNPSTCSFLAVNPTLLIIQVILRIFLIFPPGVSGLGIRSGLFPLLAMVLWVPLSSFRSVFCCSDPKVKNNELQK